MLRLACLVVLIAALGPCRARAQVAEAEAEAEPIDESEAEAEAEALSHGRADGRGEDVLRTLGDAIGDLSETLSPEPEPRNRLRWDPSWHRYRFDELVLTAGAGLVILFEELLPTRTDANWRGTTPFDIAVARALALPTPEARDAAEEISDGLVAGLMLWPVLFDSLIYAGLGEGAWDVAWQLSLISLEVFALNQVLNVLVRVLARRERPLGQFCREDPTYEDPICHDQPPAESFWSEHVSNAFAGAALVCMNHEALDLFGEGWSDGMACGTALAAAATTGLLRIMSDSHWVTDVLAGAAVGTAMGLLVPWILHFQGGARAPLTGQDAPLITVLPMVGQDTLGVSVVGMM